MRDLNTYDYATIRVVPRVEREEFVNVGVIVSCMKQKFLKAQIHLDESRVRALYPSVDMEAIRRHLETIPAICKGGKDSGPIGQLSQRERFHWLVAPRSTIIQTSPAHSGRCNDPESVLNHLMQKMVFLDQ